MCAAIAATTRITYFGIVKSFDEQNGPIRRFRTAAGCRAVSQAKVVTKRV